MNTSVLLRKCARVCGIAACCVLATPDIFGMLSFRNPDLRWVGEIAPSLMLTVGLFVLFRAHISDPLQLRSVVRRAWLPLTLVAFSVLSIRWSINREASVLACRSLLIVTVLGLALATIGPLRLVIDGVALSGVAVVAVGAWLSTKDPDRYVFGGWMGLFGNRNGFGAHVCLILPACLVAARGTWIRRSFGLASVVFLGYVLTKIQSKTALVVSAIVVTLFGCFAVLEVLERLGWSRRRRGSGVALGAIVVVGSVVLVSALTGHSPRWIRFDFTFTNRTAMWRQLVPLGRANWLHGFGRDALWTGSRGVLHRAQVLSGTGREMVTAHNGYLQEVLNVGFIGGITTIAIVGQSAIRAARSSLQVETEYRLLLLLTGATLGLLNTMESMFSSPISFAWIVVLLATGLPQTDYFTANANGDLSHK